MSIHVLIGVVEGPAKGARFEFEQRGSLLVGRAPDAGLSLPADDRLSRYHLILDVSPPQVRIRDLDSSNGTFVNRARVGDQGMALTHGDEIHAGQSVLRIQIEEVLPVTDSMLLQSESEMPTVPLAAVVPERCMRCGKRGSSTITLLRAQRVVSLCPACRDAIRHQPFLAPGYRLVREIGCGAMGCVFLVYHEALQQQRALKQILPNASLTPAEWERARSMFLREAREQASLRHPNIVEVYDVVESQPGIPAIVMEYVDGVSAEKVLELHGRPGLPVNVVASIACHALAALDHAHRAGIVHRDVKDANLLVTRDESGKQLVKLADFGLARCFQQSGLSGIDTPDFMAGTLPYMPQEQLLSFRDVKPPGDIYSLGATIYRMLTGRYPLAAHNENVGNAYLAILESAAIPLQNVLPSVPGELAAIVDRALQKRPEERWPSAAAMRSALLPFAGLGF